MTGQPTPSNPRFNTSIRFSKRSPTVLVNPGGSPQYSSGKIDVKEGVLYIDKEILDQITLTDRSGATINTIIHQYVSVQFIIAAADYGNVDIDYCSISNITATNTIDVELENGVQTKFKSLDKITKSKQGIDFIARYNTRKETGFSIPLLTHDEFRNLDKNVFRYTERQPFFIFPLGFEAELFETYEFAGFMKLKDDYMPMREEYDVYEIKNNLIEVI